MLNVRGKKSVFEDNSDMDSQREEEMFKELQKERLCWRTWTETNNAKSKEGVYGLFIHVSGRHDRNVLIGRSFIETVECRCLYNSHGFACNVRINFSVVI